MLVCSLRTGVFLLLCGSYFPLRTRREESFVGGFVSGCLSELLLEAFEAGGYVNKTIKLRVLLGLLLLRVVPSFLESCIKLVVFVILVSFATLTGGDGGGSGTTDDVRIMLLAVLVASVFHHLSYI